MIYGWHLSYCSSISTIRGGTRVDHVADQLVPSVVAAVNKKNKTAGVKPFQIKNHLWVIVSALIHNLIFDSRTEETLTTCANSFGSKCELLPQFHKKGNSPSSPTPAKVILQGNCFSTPDAPRAL